MPPAQASPTQVTGTAVSRVAAAICDLVSPLLGIPAALAVPLCTEPPPRKLLYKGLGVLEAVIIDDRGRLFCSNQTTRAASGSVLRIDRPGARPVELVSGIHGPGGLAFHADGRLIVGYGDSPAVGVLGNVAGLAGLLLVDPESGAQQRWVSGLGMANGVARAPDGTIFASNDLAMHIDRVDPAGNVERRWARVPSANGLAIDRSGRYLYAAQTFVPAAIKRVEIARPASVVTYARPPMLGRASMLDGLARDELDRLYVAANGAGQIWRVERDGTICVLARGLKCPSAIALGQGPTGFKAGNLYAVTFHGDIVELEGVICRSLANTTIRCAAE